jgi:hypothetical protein
MNNSSFKIYLTRSLEAAHILADGLRSERMKQQLGEIISTSSGSVGHDCRIPEIYHDSGYFYAIVQYKAKKGWEYAEYEIVRC